MIPGIIAGGAVETGTLWTMANMAAPPSFWVDDTSGTNISSPDLVNDWFDRSGNSWGANMLGTTRPTLTTSPWQVDFAGGDYMNIATGSFGLYQNVASAWMFGVWKRDTADGSNIERPVLAWANNSTMTRVGLYAGGAQSGAANKIQMGGRRVDGDSFDRVDSVATHAGAWVMALGLINYTARTIDLWVNGSYDVGKTSAFGGSGNTSNTASSRSRISSNMTASPASTLNGHIALLAAGVTLPTTDEINRIFGYAAWDRADLGLVSLLPVGHPYKSAPPYV
jgi:hypothetical protein